MEDFLTRLIGRASGTAELLQPLVRPMFAKGESVGGDYNQSLDFEEETEDLEENRAYAPFHNEMNTLINDESLLLHPVYHEAKTPDRPLPSGEIGNTQSPLDTGKHNSHFQSPEADVRSSDNFISNKPLHGSLHNKTPDKSSLEKPLHGSFPDKATSKKSFDSATYNSSASKSISRSNLCTPIDHSISIKPDNEKKSDASAPITQKIIEKQNNEVVTKPNPTSQPFHSKLVIRPEVSLQKEKKDPVQKAWLSSSPRPTQSQPTVRVTIGRVEVRAMMPPVKTPQRASSQRSSSTQSLSDYLKYGSGGQK